MLRFVLDEHLRGPLWSTIVRHNVQGGLPIDVVRVGDRADLPLGSHDSDILLWAESESRILITEDVNSIPGFLADHLQAGRHSPGVFVVRAGSSLRTLILQLELVAHAGVAVDYEDAITYIP